MATIDNTETFNNMPLVQKVQTYETSSVSASDVVQMVAVKSGFRVTRVTVTNDALGDGSTAITVDVGDGSDANRFVSAQDVSSAGSTSFTLTADSEGYLYTSDDTIDITFNTSAPGAGDISLLVEGYFDYA